MKRIGTLKSRVSAVVAQMGHPDLIAIVDLTFLLLPLWSAPILRSSQACPVSSMSWKSLSPEFCVEEVIVATEMRSQNPELHSKLAKDFRDVRLSEASHEELKLRSASCKAIVGTGECKPYANILLRSGATF